MATARDHHDRWRLELSAYNRRHSPPVPRVPTGMPEFPTYPTPIRDPITPPAPRRGFWANSGRRIFMPDYSTWDFLCWVLIFKTLAVAFPGMESSATRTPLTWVACIALGIAMAIPLMIISGRLERRYWSVRERP